MAEFFGDLERLAADLYPWRWPILVGILLVIVAVAAYGYRKGWHQVILRHKVPIAIVGTPVLALVVFIGYDLGSPLFTNKTVEEEFPFAFSAIVPPEMTRDDVEKIMAGIAKVDQEMSEPMPEPVKEVATPEPTATPTPTPVPTATPTPTPILGAGQTPAPEAVSEPTPTPLPTATLTPTPRPTATPTPTPKPTATPTPVPVAAPTGGAVKLKTGDFRDQDSFHKGSGEATIYRGPDGSLLLRLENLRVTNGPDLHVILTPHPDPDNQSDVKATGYVDLGKLKGNIGNQNYPIPGSVDVSAQGSVVIYCKPFHVIFSVATLQDLG